MIYFKIVYMYPFFYLFLIKKTKRIYYYKLIKACLVQDVPKEVKMFRSYNNTNKLPRSSRKKIKNYVTV